LSCEVFDQSDLIAQLDCCVFLSKLFFD